MIQEIRLKNFKCFEDETVALAPLNLWAGLNGMGKSTVIQALLLLRQNYELGLLQQDGGLSLNGEFIQIGNSRDLLYQYFKDQHIGIEITADGASTVRWIWDAGVNSDNLPFIDKQGDPESIFIGPPRLF